MGERGLHNGGVWGAVHGDWSQSHRGPKAGTREKSVDRVSSRVSQAVPPLRGEGALSAAGKEAGLASAALVGRHSQIALEGELDRSGGVS